MIYLFFILFFIYLIVDYIYISVFFDSKFFMNTSGSKIKYILNVREGNNKFNISKAVNKLFRKDNLKVLIILIFFLLIFNSINFIFFKRIIFSKFVVLDIGYKKIELVSTFENHWQHFKNIYIILQNIFLVIIFTKVVILYNTKLKNLRQENVNENGISKDKIYIGSNGKETIYLNKEELYKNLLITGSIGTGKTYSGINKFCKYMVENKISGLIIDIKGNYVETVEKFRVNQPESELVIISEESNITYNPLKSNIRSLEMANRLRRVLELVSTSSSSDPYWLDKVENVLFNLIVLIKYVSPEKLDLKEIHNLVTDDEYLKMNINNLKCINIEEIGNAKTAHEINNVIMFFSKEYFNLDSRVLSIIKSEITRLTIPFVTEYDICNKFATNHNDGINILFNNSKPKIYLLSINMSKNFLLSKMLATFIKLEFQSFVLENINNPVECFCICDEYQEFANVQDSHFLSLSREAKCMNIFSMQSYSSLINILKNEQASKVIIQNLVNKIWFRNDDNYTIEEILKQIGRERKLLKTSTISEGASESKKRVFKGFKNHKSNISESVSYAENNDYIFEANVISRDLKTFEALVLLSENGKMNNVKKVKLI